jgi:hypothetical protein
MWTGSTIPMRAPRFARGTFSLTLQLRCVPLAVADLVPTVGNAPTSVFGMDRGQISTPIHSDSHNASRPRLRLSQGMISEVVIGTSINGHAMRWTQILVAEEFGAHRGDIMSPEKT